jgi:hypothetical protein
MAFDIEDEDDDEHEEGKLHNFVLVLVLLLVLDSCLLKFHLMLNRINILQGQNTWLKKNEY